MLVVRKLQYVPWVARHPLFHSNKLKIGVDPVVPHLDGRPEIANRTEEFPAVFLGVDPTASRALLPSIAAMGERGIHNTVSCCLLHSSALQCGG